MTRVPVSRQVHDIPPSPRHVRWSAVLWRRWPLALAGFVMAIFGGLVTLMLTYHRAGSAAADDGRLDEHGVETTARVTAITPSPAHLGDEPAVKVEYTFLAPASGTAGTAMTTGSTSTTRPTSAANPPNAAGTVETANGQAPADARPPAETAPRVHSMRGDGRPADPIAGSVLALDGQFEVGRAYPVLYLSDEPHLNRLVGTRLSRLVDLVNPFLGGIVLPGVLLLLLWLQSVLDLKHLMAAGDVTVGEIVSLTQVPIVNPTMLRVHYRFRGRHAEPEEGWHWVRARSLLGQRLREGPRPRVVVVHDRRRPHKSRIVLPEDFCRRTPDQENWQGELSRPV